MKNKYHRVGFTAAQSAELWDCWRKGESLNAIGRKFGKPSSCIFAHVRPTGGISPAPRRPSRAAAADKQAWKQASRPKPCKLAEIGRLRQAVVVKFQRHRSPEQIAGWLKRKAPDSEADRVSHETIHRSPYVQARGALKKELIQYLRSQRQLRSSRYARQNTDQRGQIRDAASISERPACVEDRAVPGLGGRLALRTQQSLHCDTR